MTKVVALGMASLADELRPVDFPALRPGLELSGQQLQRRTLARRPGALYSFAGGAVGGSQERLLRPGMSRPRSAATPVMLWTATRCRAYLAPRSG